MSVRVSVIIPCHNHARYLPRAVESVLAQTFADFEIVIVDDGSTDDTSKVAAKLARENPGKIRVVRQEQQGAPRARNAGAKESGADYLLFLDCDDTIEPRMLGATVATMDSDAESGIVYTFTHHRSDPDDPPDPDFDDQVQEYPAFRLAEWIRHNPQLDSCSLVRREAFEQAGGLDPEQFAEDLDLWLGIVKRGWTARLVPEPLFNYWHHGGPRESSESWTRPIDLRWQLMHKHPELYDDRERLFVSSLALAFVLSDSVDLVQSFIAPEANMDWDGWKTELEVLQRRFVLARADCASAAPIVSPQLAGAISRLLTACENAGTALDELTEACRERDTDKTLSSAESFIDTLPSVADAMMGASRVGMPEVYGDDSSNTRLH